MNKTDPTTVPYFFNSKSYAKPLTHTKLLIPQIINTNPKSASYNHRLKLFCHSFLTAHKQSIGLEAKYVSSIVCLLKTALMHSAMDHIVIPTNNTMSAFTRHKHSPGGATTHIRIGNAWVQLTTHLSTPKGWMAQLGKLADIQWMVYPEVTH